MTEEQDLIIKLRQVLVIAAEEMQRQREIKGLPPLDHIGRWESIREHKALRAYLKSKLAAAEIQIKALQADNIELAKDNLARAYKEHQLAEQVKTLTEERERIGEHLLTAIQQRDKANASYVASDESAFQLQQQIKALTADLAAMTIDRDLWRDAHDADCPNSAMVETLEEANLEQAEQIKTLQTAIGLVLSLHGCSGDSCTEAQYLADAETLITQVGALTGERDGERAKHDNLCTRFVRETERLRAINRDLVKALEAIREAAQFNPRRTRTFENIRALADAAINTAKTSSSETSQEK